MPAQQLTFKEFYNDFYSFKTKRPYVYIVWFLTNCIIDMLKFCAEFRRCGIVTGEMLNDLVTQTVLNFISSSALEWLFQSIYCASRMHQAEREKLIKVQERKYINSLKTFYRRRSSTEEEDNKKTKSKKNGKRRIN